MKFQDASDLKLAALYKLLRTSDDDIYLSPITIKQTSGNRISAAYVKWIASSELFAEFIEGSPFIVDNVREIRFRISDAGIDYIEQKFPSLADNVNAEPAIPAADRIVKLDHNQIIEIDGPSKEIIDLLEQDNGIAEEPDFRNIVIARLRAGREFIRAGVFEFEIFRLTMIVGLQMIVDRYREHVIGALASTLLNLLLKQFGLDV